MVYAVTMKVLNQDVCIPIADPITPATGALTIPKSPTSVLKPSFVSIGPSLYSDPNNTLTVNMRDSDPALQEKTLAVTASTWKLLRTLAKAANICNIHMQMPGTYVDKQH